MLALYRAGRQAEALRRCAELRSMLSDEMGLGISPAAQALEVQILADDASLLRPPVARRGTSSPGGPP